MPFPFVLPTTSAFAFSTAFACPTHPSLLRTASTYRGVVRDTLKKHKRLPPEAQAANLALVVSSLQNYLPYLLAVVDGLRGGGSASGVRVVQTKTSGSPPGPVGEKSAGSPPFAIEWRPTLVDSRLPGKEPPRVRVTSLDHELAFALAALGHARTLQARAALQPLYVASSVVPVGAQQRLAAITTATRHLMEAAALFAYLAARAESFAVSAPTPEVTSPVLRALGELAVAEATLLAVLKDDPYPAAVAQDRNAHDREWMYKAPDLPKVRAHLFARLCLAAAEHAGQARGACPASLSPAFLRYLDDLQHTARAKACRFFAVDAELGGQTGAALAWAHAALRALGVEVAEDSAAGEGSNSTKTKGRPNLLSRLKKERSDKREDRRVERGTGWGADAGRLEETRVLEMLDAKWTKQNDTINTQRIPPAGPLLAQMPSGREIHTVQPMEPPSLEPSALEAMRAPPDPLDELEDENAVAGRASSSDDEGNDRAAGRSLLSDASTLVGAYPGTPDSHSGGGGRSSYY